MPHFIIHASSEAIPPGNEQIILESIHDQAVASGLFDEGDIKVRLAPFEKSLVAGKRNVTFIHVFSYVMGGRSVDQKQKLSKSIVTKLVELAPDVKNIAMNVYDFEPETYFNRRMISDLPK